jgi:hypothetical protein
MIDGRKLTVDDGRVESGRVHGNHRVRCVGAAVKHVHKVYRGESEKASSQQRRKRGLGFVLEDRARTRCAVVDVFASWSSVMIRNVLLSAVMKRISCAAGIWSKSLNGTENGWPEIGPET